MTRSGKGRGSGRGQGDGPSRGKAGATGGRGLHVRVKTARGRKLSSTRWLQRQLNDPFVRAAREAGYRSRAAYKLVELDDRFHFLKPSGRVLDLGAAPGAWTQVALERINPRGQGGKRGAVFALDRVEMEPLEGATIVTLDVQDEGALEAVRRELGGPVDAILSDMAAPATGHTGTDHLRIMALCEAACDLALHLLRPGGTLVVKVLQGGAEAGLLAQMKKDFASVKHVKPKASRSDSAEIYAVAMGFRGVPKVEG
ncbi:MAG: RlmE family RNA methyltransferase [Proteobacteria bacterium]|nr:RlmE family RNA methyltransferase [Pseudomonadota bacterium]